MSRGPILPYDTHNLGGLYFHLRMVHVRHKASTCVVIRGMDGMKTNAPATQKKVRKEGKFQDSVVRENTHKGVQDSLRETCRPSLLFHFVCVCNASVQT